MFFNFQIITFQLISLKSQNSLFIYHNKPLKFIETLFMIYALESSLLTERKRLKS